MRQNFKSDITIREIFYDVDQSGERIQSLVPENVRIEYFTPASPRVRLVCSRNGGVFHNCSLDENGRVLVCNLPLSRKSLGVGPLLKIVKNSVADASFPYDLRNREYIASTGIDLWGGPSDAGELESDSVLSEVILRYGYSAYRLAVLDGFVGTEQEWLESLIGPEGKSAYQVAVDNGFAGSLSDWLASLHGPAGDSAYEIAVEEGFEGTKSEWLASLVGPQGLSAYQVAVAEGYTGTVSEWLASLVGQPGRSAYQIAVENGFVGTEQEWLASLVGPAGKSAYQLAVDQGYDGSLSDWLASLVGPAGDSAYEIAVEEGFEGTKSEWLASLVGPQGLSAYQVAVAEGYTGTVSEWLASLVGPAGPAGVTSVTATVDSNIGTPSVDASLLNQVLSLAFHNLKGNPGQSAYQLAVSLGYTGTEQEWIASLNGQDGVGIDDVEQTVVSTANGGTNTVRISLTDGSHYDIQIKNGKSSAGLFPTAADLSAACPSPSVGDYAFVGSGFPADIYVCQTAGTWTDSGEDYDGDTIDLPESVDVVDNLESSDGSAALSARQGNILGKTHLPAPRNILSGLTWNSGKTWKVVNDVPVLVDYANGRYTDPIDITGNGDLLSTSGLYAVTFPAIVFINEQGEPISYVLIRNTEASYVETEIPAGAVQMSLCTNASAVAGIKAIVLWGKAPTYGTEEIQGLLKTAAMARIEKSWMFADSYLRSGGNALGNNTWFVKLPAKSVLTAIKYRVLSDSNYKKFALVYLNPLSGLYTQNEITGDITTDGVEHKVTLSNVDLRGFAGDVYLVVPKSLAYEANQDGIELYYGLTGLHTGQISYATFANPVKLALAVEYEMIGIPTPEPNAQESDPDPETMVLSSEFRGKGYVAFGDSITVTPNNGTAYPDRIAAYFGMSLVNKGASGTAPYASGSRPGNLTDANLAAVTAGTMLVTISGGQNDWVTAEDVNSSDRTTSIGAINYFIDQIRSIAPKCIIVLCPTYVAPSGHNICLADYQRIADNKHVALAPTADLHLIPWTNDAQSVLRYDGIHPTEYGAGRFAAVLRETIRKLVY